MESLFGIFSGVIVNTVTVLIGAAVGMIFRTSERLKTIGERIFQAFALFTIALGINGAQDINNPVLALVSIVVGVALGELLDIDRQFDKLGRFLHDKFAKKDSDGAAGFSDTFMTASFLFCIGSMTFLGAIQSGIEHNHTLYYTKAVLDCFSGMMLAMSNGLGVFFAAGTVLVYQGLLVLFASFLAPVLTAETIALSSAVGSLLLVGIGLNMLGITKLKTANFLPAMFIPFVWQAIQLLFVK